MAYVLIEDFKGGIDKRRTVVTSVPGTCVELTNAHITRGGEIEKRRAFKEWASLPSGTHGLAAGGGRVFVFGSGSTGLGDLTFPASLSYVRFQHSDLTTEMTDILGHDFFEGKVYAAVQFADGKIYHYWDEYTGSAVPVNRIDDWYEARARTYFDITGGNESSETGGKAYADITATGGSNLPGNNLRALRVNNVDIIGSPVAHTGSASSTKTAIISAINAHTSTPNYTATSSTGNRVKIEATVRGSAPNGYKITWDIDGQFGLEHWDSIDELHGGYDNEISVLKVDGKMIIEDPILWEKSNAYTASKVRDEINKTRTDPEWFATSVDSSARVNIIAYERGEGLTQLHHNLQVLIIPEGDLTISPNPAANTVAAAGSSTTSYSPGGFVRAFDNKMHSLSDSRWHFSNLAMPTDWNNTEGTSSTPDYAGFVNMSNHSRGSEELMAIAPYFQNLAIFGKDAVQIWFNDPDPAVSSRVQILNNTGTVAAKSVVEIGDSDVFYLSRSGIRSLKSRDSSNAAFVGDIGNPIDDLIVADINVNVTTTKNACGIVDPRDGRYLLAIGTRVYVFSYFPSSSITAWSIYETGFDDSITDWAYDGTQVLCRAGNKIYSLGGELNNEYDSSVVTVQLPFLDVQNPATDKMWTGLDAVCSGDWTVSVGTDPTDISTYETAATINKPTYGMGRVGLSSTSSHLALRMTNNSSGAASLGNIAVHYELINSG
jgi:hypothetical protein